MKVAIFVDMIVWNNIRQVWQKLTATSLECIFWLKKQGNFFGYAAEFNRFGLDDHNWTMLCLENFSVLLVYYLLIFINVSGVDCDKDETVKEPKPLPPIQYPVTWDPDPNSLDDKMQAEKPSEGKPLSAEGIMFRPSCVFPDLANVSRHCNFERTTPPSRFHFRSGHTWLTLGPQPISFCTALTKIEYFDGKLRYKQLLLPFKNFKHVNKNSRVVNV